MAQDSVSVETVPDTVSTATDILAVLTAPATEPVAQTPVAGTASVAPEQPLSRRAARMAALNAAAPAVPRSAERAAPLVTEPVQPVAAPASSRRAQSSARPARAVARPAGRTSTRTAQRPRLRRVVPKIISVSAALGALGLLVATSLPANAFMTSSADLEQTSVTSTAGVQKMATVDAKAVADEAPTRDNYTVQTSTDRFRTSSSTDWSYTNDPNGTIQWPFPVQVPIATGFGPRHVIGCGFCSTFHLGVDFDPGLGAPVGAIADGVVTEVDLQPSSPLGNHVTIEHTINGQKIESVYGHMITGSVRVVVGQAVKVTDIVGETGSTGHSTGAHLHLEVHVNGVPVDPFAWLKANAN
ncbi:peptidoglycan DD-metalloendopeptidase family protein [Lacisediminihabitans changchengi]|uniref:Peptidoglycan DD-metalloendopeptidase family protein n=1 Tax=Lacisediminihabitans changchengi TaxID=2787634 RepID=A0A934SPU6_9MICO|nr:peptidoglycan DD-metalloendopeptidase family protein [Lacisediminihabitans changchengi]MBK4349032.1 peptidoglycan DD-metalloendopeptidase family protein [Lacisediminihabitans changchengi]